MADAFRRIVRLTHDYALFNDTFEIERLVDLFTADAVFDMRPAGLDLYAGHEGIRDFFSRESRALSHVMHLTSNHRVDIEDGAATGTVYYLAIGVVRRTGAENQSRGYYEDTYVETDDGWRFAARVGHPLIPWTPARAPRSG